MDHCSYSMIPIDEHGHPIDPILFHDLHRARDMPYRLALRIEGGQNPKLFYRTFLSRENFTRLTLPK